MSINLKFYLLFLFIVTIALTNVWFVEKSEKNAAEKFKWVAHTHQVINESEYLLRSLQDAETGQRGFLLTNDKKYLDPYYTGVKNAQTSFEKLKQTTINKEEFHRRLDDTKKNMELKFEELAQTIQLASSGEKKRALEIVQSDKGKIMMDEIRLHIQTFQDMETMLLKEREKAYLDAQSALRNYIKLELIALIIFATGIWFLFKNIFLKPLNTLLSFTEIVRNGKRIPVDTLVSQDEIGRVISAFYQMSEKVFSYTEELKHLALHDTLTGLPNRSFAYEEISRQIRKDGRELKTAVCFLDLNRFKMVNDTLGHEAGDTLLGIAAERLQQSVRGEDVVCRLGGDEFLVILTNLSHDGIVNDILKKIQANFAKNITIGGENVDLSTSIGVAFFPDDATEVSELLKKADTAMYYSKLNNKPFTFYTDNMTLEYRFSKAGASKALAK